MSTRRSQFDMVVASGTSHAGLWLDKFVRDQQRGGDTSRRHLVEEVAARSEPAPYRAFYDRWVATLDAVGTQRRTARVLGRMVIGVGNESVVETSITLHHTYGMPYIPGSALKGLAASYAHGYLDPKHWGETSDAYITIFGTTASAGYITFFDALYIPGSGVAGKALYADVLAVHHRDYYQGSAAPADWDSPTLVPFLCANGQYLLALRGPAEWVETTFDILGSALTDLGAGAKTSSGYGRLALEGHQPAKEGLRASQSTAGTTAAIPEALPPLRQTAEGIVRYDKKNRAYIRDATGKEWRVTWKEVGLGAANPGDKTAVEFEYDVLRDGKYRVVRVTKKG